MAESNPSFFPRYNDPFQEMKVQIHRLPTSTKVYTTASSPHLKPVVVRPAHCLGPPVDPVDPLLLHVELDGPDVLAGAVDGEDDVWAEPIVHCHAADGVLLAEEEEGIRSWGGNINNQNYQCRPNNSNLNLQLQFSN